MEQSMQDRPQAFDPVLSGLSREVWFDRLEDLAEEFGYFEPLGAHHSAVFIDESPTLLVSFETVDGIREGAEKAEPIGFELVRAAGWSHLCILADGDTWFRDRAVYGYFDRLVDDGFFEDFDQVIFYGQGMGGYAAAAFSVAAPGATVIALNPRATLDPHRAGWDPRHRAQRHLSFTDRYGYAPDMLDAADQTFVLYDPHTPLNAMHAALFERPNVDTIRCPHLGEDLQTQLLTMQVLYRMLARAAKGRLTPQGLYKLLRARRQNTDYLRALLASIDVERRPYLSALLCRAILRDKRLPKVRKRLEQLEAGGVSLPAPLDRA